MKTELLQNNAYLIDCLKEGDEQAYAYLIDNYHHRLCVYANSLTKDSYQAEDIVQNIFVRIWEQRDRLKSDLSLKSYLYKMVYNEFIDQYRKQQSLLNLEKNYIEALHLIIAEDEVETFEKAHQLIKNEIQNLPQKCREVFVMSKHEGLTNIEIAEHLDISIKTVEAQITKAFSLLRTALKDKLALLALLLQFLFLSCGLYWNLEM